MSKVTYLFMLSVAFLSLILYLLASRVDSQNHPEQTKRLNNSTKVIIYSKENCLFCIKTKELLDKKNIKYLLIDIGKDEKLRSQLHQETNQSTVPYIFINNKFIGGYEQLLKLEETGNMEILLE